MSQAMPVSIDPWSIPIEEINVSDPMLFKQEMQLRTIWEEIHKRFHTIEVMDEPVRVASNIVRGYADLPVRVHPSFTPEQFQSGAH
jgi:hypothetical protein